MILYKIDWPKNRHPANFTEIRSVGDRSNFKSECRVPIGTMTFWQNIVRLYWPSRDLCREQHEFGSFKEVTLQWAGTHRRWEAHCKVTDLKLPNECCSRHKSWRGQYKRAIFLKLAGCLFLGQSILCLFTDSLHVPAAGPPCDSSTEPVPRSHKEYENHLFCTPGIHEFFRDV